MEKTERKRIWLLCPEVVPWRHMVWPGWAASRTPEQQRRQQTPGEQGRGDLGKEEKRVRKQRIRTKKLK